jgi:zinc protease
MIDFKRTILENGLRILYHEDTSTPLVALNIIYDVGSRDDDQDLTGMAHLFEHLMFGGSKNIPDFDTPLQMAGAENNAFTNNDFTNYYVTIPANNLETGFWLESDRMLSLSFSDEVLKIQKKVVIEEFKQRYLNQPYGDAMLLLRPLAYKVHPYLWSTIGKDISHIEKVSLSNVRDFFFAHYAPNNAILSVTGNIRYEEVLRLAKKWFGPIGRREIPVRNLPAEPFQANERKIEIERDVPSDVLYKAWHVCERVDKDFNSLDVLTDILAGGESGRLYTSLVRDRKLFSDINTYATGEIDPGLLILNGKLMDGIDFASAEDAVNEVIDDILKSLVPELEMEKVKNRFESSTVFSNTSIQTKAISLGFHDLDPSNSSTMYYKSIKSGKKQ